MTKSGCSKQSLDYENAFDKTQVYKNYLVHDAFIFQGGLSFKEWIVLDGCSFDSKPLMLESYSKMKDNIVGGLTSHKTNGSHHRTI